VRTRATLRGSRVVTVKSSYARRGDWAGAMADDDSPSGELIRASIVARILGLKPRTVNRWVETGKISGAHIEKLYYVHRSAFDAIRDPEKRPK
jgi:hypothetical protein